MNKRVRLIKRELPFVLLLVIVAIPSAYVGGIVSEHLVPGGANGAETNPFHAPMPASVAIINLDGTNGTSGELTFKGRAAPLLALVLEVDCEFCSQNVPQWRELARRVVDIPGADVRVLSRSNWHRTEAYLADNALPVIAALLDAEGMTALSVTGYPATVAVVPNSDVIWVWRGVLSPSHVSQIIEVLSSS